MDKGSHEPEQPPSPRDRRIAWEHLPLRALARIDVAVPLVINANGTILAPTFGGGANSLVTEMLGDDAIISSDFGGNPPYEKMKAVASICYRHYLARTNVLFIIGGKSNKPTPIPPHEVDKIMQQMQEGIEKPRPKILTPPGCAALSSIPIRSRIEWCSANRS